MDYFAAFKLWEATPPPFLDDLLALPAGLELPLANGYIRVPWPMFRAEEIASAFAILRDWEIPNNFIPVGGDFHDLLCLDVSKPDPDLVLIDDARRELARFPNPSDFFAIIRSADPRLGNTSGISEDKSWLGC